MYQSSYNTLIDNINNALESILGGESQFLSLFDCKFIKEDIIRFCDRFSNHVYKSSFSIFLCFIFMGFCAYIGVYFLLLSMYRFSQEVRIPDAETTTKHTTENKEEPQDDSATVKPIVYSKVDVESNGNVN